jgi:translation initiation factor IF-2
MTETNDKDGRKALSLNKPLEAKKSAGGNSQVRQNFTHGRSKTVQVEVRKKRSTLALGGQKPAAAKPAAPTAAKKTLHVTKPATPKKKAAEAPKASAAKKAADILTNDEKAARAAALELAREQSLREEAERKAREEAEAKEAARKAAEAPEADEAASAESEKQAEPVKPKKRRSPEERRRAEEEEARRLLEEANATKEAQVAVHREKVKSSAKDEELRREAKAPPPRNVRGADGDAAVGSDHAGGRKKASKHGRGGEERYTPTRKPNEQRRRSGRLTIGEALDDRGPKQRSLASIKRARKKQQQVTEPPQKIFREVTIPEVISVQELANRMSERSVDVIKALMKLGIMATANQTIDADTAELVVDELGHKARRIAESDVEIGLGGEEEDAPEDLKARAPVVAVMGHVDHGKTSLLDALRKSDVVSGEAGGITQHIGAYQVTLASGEVMTFLDTPGHEAFTAMRMRGAQVTDIVILVVAADDSVMPQTIEAIKHAKAAEVPIIVAINKCDKPAADPNKVRQELLQHEIFVEDMGGDVLDVEVSAKTGAGLDKLQEAILLQAELLELKANPNRSAQGTVVEAKLETGRGMVGTVLVSRGTLRVGDFFVMGPAMGKVRALLDYRGQNVQEAGPSVPVEVLGIQGTPTAGDDFVVTETEGQAKEIATYRQRLEQDKKVTATARGTIEQMFSAIKEGTADELPVVIKADVQGSAEAITNALENLNTDEVAVKILFSGVGGITESDVSLAAASRAIIIAFNTRANKQARDEAESQGIDIQYYSVIYNVIDDMKAMLSGMLAPTIRENFLGYAEIREVFNISKVGKIAGCMITEGSVKRGSKVRLLRDDVVIHEGTLSTLKRFKDEVKEVKSGMECGMAFENYHDIKVGDFIECFEVEEVAREL